jgi:hypothetical protein
LHHACSERTLEGLVGFSEQFHRPSAKELLRMQTFTRWLFLGLVLAWSLSHATVFGGGGEKKSPASATERIRQALDQNITVNYTGQSLRDAIQHLREKTSLPISLDQMVLLQMGINPDENTGQIELKATNEKAGAVIRKALNNFRLSYVVCEDAVLVTAEEYAVHRQMRQRVSVDIEEVPFSKAARDLARANGVNLIIDPRVNNKAKEKVSLQMDNLGLETAIRLLAELADVKSVRMGNVLFVTTDERAEKIRKEEQQNDPLNPNPLMPGLIGQGGIGGGFGGIIGGVLQGRPGVAVPGIAVPDIGAPDRPVDNKQAPPAPPAPGNAVPGAAPARDLPAAPPQVGPAR